MYLRECQYRRAVAITNAATIVAKSTARPTTTITTAAIIAGHG